MFTRWISGNAIGQEYSGRPVIVEGPSHALAVPVSARGLRVFKAVSVSMRVSAKHVLIAANPKSGAVSSQQRVSELCAMFQMRGYDARILSSLDGVVAEALPLHASGDLRAVVSAGGDGTVAALANLLPADIPLLIFPLGTENLLAKHLGLDGNPRSSVELLESGRVVSLDVGRANGKLFLVMLSCGFDAEVVRRMHAIRSGHISRWSYFKPISEAMGSYRFPQLLPQFDPSERVAKLNRENSASAAWLFAFNVPRYAAGLNFCPQADPTDGLLDICMFQRSGLMTGLGYFVRLWLRTHQSMRGFEHLRCESLLIPAALDSAGQELEVPFQIDGDPGGTLPLHVETLPGRLSLICPKVCL